MIEIDNDNARGLKNVHVVAYEDVRYGDFGIFQDALYCFGADNDGHSDTYIQAAYIISNTTDNRLIIADEDGEYQIYPADMFAVFLHGEDVEDAVSA